MKITLKSQQDSSLGETYKIETCQEFVKIETFSEAGDLEQILRLPRDVFDAINTNLKVKELCI